METLNKKIDLGVFLPVTIVLVATIIIGLVIPDTFANASSAMLAWITTHFKPLFLITNGVITIGAILFCFSPFSKRIVGGEEAKPELGIFSYICVVLTGSIGSAALFWGVPEVMAHFYSPPPFVGEEATSSGAAGAALALFTNHWSSWYFAGLSLWCVAIGYMSFEKGLPLRPSSALWPILKDRVLGPWGKAIDVFCLFGVLGGITCSFGFGTTQIAAGLNYSMGLPENTLIYGLIILVIGIGFIISSSAGVQKGIKKVADLNGWFYIALFVVLYLIGPTTFLLNMTMEGVGHWFTDFISHVTTGAPLEDDGGWSVSYASSNAVWTQGFTAVSALFFVMVSKGRSYRQMVLFTFVPSILLSIVMGVTLGGNGIYLQEYLGVDIMGMIDEQGVSASAFILFEQFPVLKLIGAPLMAFTLIFSFITMADNMTFSMAQLTSKDLEDGATPKKSMRIFWGALVCLLTLICLLIVGQIGMKGVQNIAGVAGIPYYFVCAGMVLCVAWIATGKAGKDFKKVHPKGLKGDGKVSANEEAEIATIIEEQMKN